MGAGEPSTALASSDLILSLILLHNGFRNKHHREIRRKFVSASFQGHKMCVSLGINIRCAPMVFVNFYVNGYSSKGLADPYGSNGISHDTLSSLIWNNAYTSRFMVLNHVALRPIRLARMSDTSAGLAMIMSSTMRYSSRRLTL